VPFLRLRENGIARPCIYFDVICVIHTECYRFSMGVNENGSFFTLKGPKFWYVINRILNSCKFILNVLNSLNKILYSPEARVIYFHSALGIQ
jgi:hypothetical protein